MGRQGMVVGEELSPLPRQVVTRRYIFGHEMFRMVCTHVFEEEELVEVVRSQDENVFGAMQEDKRVAFELIDWANKIENIEKKLGWND